MVERKKRKREAGRKKEEKRNSGGLTGGWEGREEGRRKMIGWRAGMLRRYQGEEDGKQSGV